MHSLGNLVDEDVEGITHENELSVISNEAARCSVVNHACGGRSG